MEFHAKRTLDIQKVIPWAIGTLAFLYYWLLAAKTWTWTFVSGDSGDWLAASTWWFAPQPYGSPLYITLGHLVNLLPGSLPSNMTILLSCVPAAVTVAMVYLIAKKLTGRTGLAIVASLVLAGCAIFLSQSTVLEEYALSTMLFTIAFWFYVNDNKPMTILFLGIGTAVHIIVGFLTFIWFLLNIKDWKAWLRYVPLYFVTGVLPYGLILLLMHLDTPMFLAGKLSLKGINEYLGASSTVGSISLQDTPKRLLDFFSIALVSLGLAWFPLVKGMQKPWNKVVLTIISTMVVCAWLYVTNNGITTWTFMIFSLPLASVLVAIGLSKLEKFHTQIVAVGACCLVLVNGFFLNANLITKANPSAVKFYTATMSLPDGAVIVTPRGGDYAFGVFYAITQGKDLIPLFLTGKQSPDSLGYNEYLQWVRDKWDIPGNNVLEQTKWCLAQGKPVYYITPMIMPIWGEKFTVTNTDEYYSKVTDCSEVMPVWPSQKINK